LTGETLKQVKQLIQTAHQHHEEVGRDLVSARAVKAISQARFESCDRGMLLKNSLKKALEKRREVYGTETARVAEFEEQLKLSTIATNIQIDKEQADPYYRMRDQFAALSECQAIWDVKTRQATVGTTIGQRR
jgi:hypothetical protein